jgi:adenosine deaminase
MIEFKKMPKIELHTHLDGGVRVNTIADILKLDVNEVRKKCVVTENNPNLTAYLKSFDLPVKAMQTKQNLTRIAKEFALDLKEDGVIYAEVRFAPLKHTSQISAYSVISSVLKGFKQVDDIKIKVILCMMRDETIKKNKKVIRLAKLFTKRGVCAIDLAGDEFNYKTSEFKELFDYAKKLKIPYTIHAGEADDFTSVNSAISFATTRIGHGVRSMESFETITSLAQKKVCLELCPKSNLDTKVFEDYKNLPITVFIKHQIPVTINTDNRTVSNTTLSKEYEELCKTFGFDIASFISFNISAIEYSFLSPREKKELLKLYKKKITVDKKD